MADGDLYDEFGNYIGPELSESEEVLPCCRQHSGDERLFVQAWLPCMPAWRCCLVCGSLLLR